MPIIRIDDAADPRIADYRNVPDPDLLRRRGLFVAENRLVVRRLLASACFRALSVLVTDAAYRALCDDLAPFEPTLPIYVCAKALMEPVVGYNIHRGCLALGVRPDPQSVSDLLAALGHERGAAASEPRHSIIVLEGITNADNVGAVFRNARAFGADGIVVGPGCCDPLYRKAIRVSIGATLEVPYATSVGPPGPDPWDPASAGFDSSAGFDADFLTLKRAGFTVVALTPAGDAVDLDTFASGPLPDKIALLVGNEGEGLSAGAQRASDVRVRIAMAPGVDSLNVSTATGIALYRLSTVGS
jgi:tRNA G18 (ribose-2'-O)-methylase SpoU